MKNHCEVDDAGTGWASRIRYPCVRGHLTLGEDGVTRCFMHHDIYLRQKGTA